jgi:hypothetical protein
VVFFPWPLLHPPPYPFPPSMTLGGLARSMMVFVHVGAQMNLHCTLFFLTPSPCYFHFSPLLPAPICSSFNECIFMYYTLDLESYCLSHMCSKHSFHNAFWMVSYGTPPSAPLSLPPSSILFLYPFPCRFGRGLFHSSLQFIEGIRLLLSLLF